MERREHSRLLVHEAVGARLTLDGRRVRAQVRDLSRGGMRLALPGSVRGVPALVSACRPLRLEVFDLDPLTALPRWSRRRGSSGWMLGASLDLVEEPQPFRLLPEEEAAPEGAITARARFLLRRALVLHLAGRDASRGRAAREAQQVASELFERLLQRLVTCEGDAPFLDESRLSMRLAAGDQLVRLGEWTGSQRARLEGTAMRIVARLTCGLTKETRPDLAAYEALARDAGIPSAIWAGKALGAIAGLLSRTPARYAASARTLLERREFGGIGETNGAFPTASCVGTLAGVLALLRDELPRRRSASGARRRGAGRGRAARPRSSGNSRSA